MNERKHAIVIGASMAGLLATRVLSNHFTQVNGVPQGWHTHGLLRPGHVVFNRADEQDLGALGGHDLTVV